MWKRPCPPLRTLGVLALAASALTACQREPAAGPERTGAAAGSKAPASAPISAAGSGSAPGAVPSAGAGSVPGAAVNAASAAVAVPGAAASAAGAAAAVPSAAASGAARPELPPCAEDDDGCRADRLGAVTVGPLREGLSVAEVVALLGAPAQKEKPYEEGATGLWRAEWTWPARGVSLSMAGNNAEAAAAAPTVHAITVEAPFAGATDRGIALGATEAAVLAAYREVIDPQGSRPGELVVAGSLFGGVLFGLKDGKVTSIFVGASAE